MIIKIKKRDIFKLYRKYAIIMREHFLNYFRKACTHYYQKYIECDITFLKFQDEKNDSF